MKKFMLLLALILIASLCFAQYDNDEGEEEFVQPKIEKFDLELSFGMPIHWTNAPNDHQFWQTGIFDTDKTVTSNTAFGLSMIFNFTRKIGLTLDVDFFFGSDVMGNSPTDSYSNTLLGANALLGPVIYLYSGIFLRIPLAFGVHFYYWGAEHWLPTEIKSGYAWFKIRDLQLGPGLYLGIQFHFNNNMYIFSRTNVNVDIFRRHEVWYQDSTGAAEKKAETEFFKSISWSVKPAIGLGIKF